MYCFASGTIVSACTGSPSIPGTQPVSSNISLASFRRAMHSSGILIMARAAKENPNGAEGTLKSYNSEVRLCPAPYRDHVTRRREGRLDDRRPDLSIAV